MTINSFEKLIILAKLIPRLGFINIFRIAKHRTLLKFNLHPVCHLDARIDKGDFFSKVQPKRNLLTSSAWKTSLKYFDWYEIPIPINGIPNWFSKPFSGGDDWPSCSPWWKIEKSEDPIIGDIKEVWDISRFNWLLSMAQRAATGDDVELIRLNQWLEDWIEKNPPYIGPNWGCGQEAAIRVMHLAAAAIILEQNTTPTTSVQSFVKAHLMRIESTLSYALSQDNNHGVLEAAGLFVGGEWLYSVSEDDAAKKWADLGRKWLEERVEKLISVDGSFSMYSTSYHREFLDSLTFCELWRRKYHLKCFSDLYMSRVCATALWLRAHTSAFGDAPNIGANDGTRLFPLVDSNHRDFRPSVQAACIFFVGKRAYPPGDWDMPLKWLGVSIPEDILLDDESRVFNGGGFAVLRSGREGNRSKIYIRYPRFRFRPAQPDLLHLDLWINGLNLLPDAGTFSYNSKHNLGDYFASTKAHNTIQFDDRDQMRRIGRFLFADWPRNSQESLITRDDGGIEFSAQYQDYRGCKHRRSLLLDDSSLRVRDDISGFVDKAVLIWRLAPGDWRVARDENEILIYCENSFELKKISIRVSADMDIKCDDIKTGWMSKRYFQKEPVSVVEIEMIEPGAIITEIKWMQ
jgi:hypothetical protein